MAIPNQASRKTLFNGLLTDAKLLKSEREGRRVYYSTNCEHPLFPELRSMVGKVAGLDRVIARIISRLGNVEKAFLIGDYAEGKGSGIIDLVLMGNINPDHLYDLSTKTERYTKIKSVLNYIK